MSEQSPDIDLVSLRCFEAAATLLNFRAAASRVALSPTAFTDRMHRLEAELGAKLFLRTTRQVRLTVAGRRLLPQARRTLAEAARCRLAVHDRAVTPPIELVVGTRYELGLSWLCPALTPLSKARPERRLHLYMGDSPDLVARLERGDIDAIVSSVRLTSGRLEYVPLHPEEYVFVGTTQRVRKPADTVHLTLLDVSSDLPLFRYLLDATPEIEHWPFAHNEYLGGIGAIRHRLLEGAGVAVLPRYFMADDLSAGRVVELLPRLRCKTDAFRLVWRRGHPHEEELHKLASELRALPLR